jgi:transposase InsO family protein
MTDENIVAVSCSAVYAVLRKAGLKKKLAACAEESMKWFERPRSVHEQWHRDFSYIKRGGSFYYFAAVLDGCSRMILGWGFCLTMESLTVQAVAREAKGRYPRGNPRLATDNGSQFVSGDFKELVMLLEMRRAFIRPGHPQSNGKLERFQRTLKSEEARGSAYFDYEDARKRLAGWIETTTRFGCTARFII